MELAKSIVDVLENNGICVFDPTFQGGEWYTEIEFTSDLQEDCIFTIWYDGTKRSYISAFGDLAYDFDPDEHAEMWIQSRGRNGVPTSVRALIDDADGIKEFLEDVAMQLRKIA